MPHLFTNRAAASRYIAMLAVFFLSSLSAAHASTTNCSATDASLSCRLTGVLHWLEATAIVLVIVLLAVIGIAIRVYRKNRPDHQRPVRPGHR